jgi:hypothetical protein
MALNLFYLLSLVTLLGYLFYLWRRLTRNFTIIITDKEVNSSAAAAVQFILKIYHRHEKS